MLLLVLLVAPSLQNAQKNNSLYLSLSLSLFVACVFISFCKGALSREMRVLFLGKNEEKWQHKFASSLR